jgi:hypothetical protein
LRDARFLERLTHDAPGALEIAFQEMPQHASGRKRLLPACALCFFRPFCFTFLCRRLAFAEIAAIFRVL